MLQKEWHQSSKMRADDNPEVMTCQQEPREGADSRQMTPFPSTVEQPSVQRRRNQPLNCSKSATSRPLKVLLSTSRFTRCTTRSA
jgi:hypothetical protein